MSYTESESDCDVRVVDSEDEEEMRRMREQCRKRPRKSYSGGSSEIRPVGNEVNQRNTKIARHERTTGASIDDLSDDLLVQIFLHVGEAPRFMRLRGVCKKWKSVAKDPRLWTSLTFDDFEHVSDHTMLGYFDQPRSIQNLKRLSLARCHRITEDLVCRIPKSACVSSLEAVDLSWCSGASSSSVVNLSRCPGLKEVRLSYCSKVDGRDVKDLAIRCPLLEILDLNCISNIKNGHLLKIAENCRNLRYLNVANARNVTDGAISCLVENCKRLEVLNLSWCSKITDAALLAIANNLPNLRELGLNETQATNVGLHEVVQKCRNLEELHLARCSIGDVGAKSIALNCRTNLKTLNLASCEEISDRAVQAILYTCTDLKTLDVSSLPCRKISHLLSEVSRDITVYY